MAVLPDIRVTASQQVKTFQGQFWARWIILTFKYNDREVFYKVRLSVHRFAA
jgi:hypothetical protein